MSPMLYKKYIDLSVVDRFDPTTCKNREGPHSIIIRLFKR